LRGIESLNACLAQSGESRTVNGRRFADRLRYFSVSNQPAQRFIFNDGNNHESETAAAAIAGSSGFDGEQTINRLKSQDKSPSAASLAQRLNLRIVHWKVR
jgi:hypothetical protein